MTRDAPFIELIGRTADDSLLEPGSPARPASLGAPPSLPERPGRSPLVGIGVALGALTLIGGIGLAVRGVAQLTSGASVTAVAELCAGILLFATHWGWVHVAAWINDRRADRRCQLAMDRGRAWLEAIEPYPRHEVATRVADDGSLTIEKHSFRPVAAAGERFRFERHTELSETYPADAPAASIAERAELLRRQAAAQTAQARQAYEAAARDRETACLRGRDAHEQIEARRATSQALSEQINTKLREPPLVE